MLRQYNVLKKMKLERAARAFPALSKREEATSFKSSEIHCKRLRKTLKAYYFSDAIRCVRSVVQNMTTYNRPFLGMTFEMFRKSRNLIWGKCWSIFSTRYISVTFSFLRGYLRANRYLSKISNHHLSLIRLFSDTLSLSNCESIHFSKDHEMFSLLQHSCNVIMQWNDWWYFN